MAETDKAPTASKTMWIGAMGSIVAILNEIMPVAQQFADKEITRTVLISSIVMMILRAVTKSPLVFPKK